MTKRAKRAKEQESLPGTLRTAGKPPRDPKNSRKDPGTGSREKDPGTGSREKDPGTRSQRQDPGTRSQRQDPRDRDREKDPGTGTERRTQGPGGSIPRVVYREVYTPGVCTPLYTPGYTHLPAPRGVPWHATRDPPRDRLAALTRTLAETTLTVNDTYRKERLKERLKDCSERL